MRTRKFLAAGGAPRSRGAKRRRIQERRQGLDAGRRRGHRAQPCHVVARWAKKQVRAPDGRHGAAVARIPRAPRPLGRVRRLGDHVGNAERGTRFGSDPVWRLVVRVIGEPESGPRAGRSVAPLRGQSPAQSDALLAQRGLAIRIACGFVAAEIRGELDVVAGARERLHQQTRDAAVSRGRGVRRRFQRRVKSDAHRHVPGMNSSPPFRDRSVAQGA